MKRNWEYRSIKSGALIYDDVNPNNFLVCDGGHYIYFHHKYYSILKAENTEDGTFYHTECIRHTGKKHIKFETVFHVRENAVGYCETFYKEV